MKDFAQTKMYNELPGWYGKTMHEEVVRLIASKDMGKLHAVKYLCDLSTEHGTRDTFGLSQGKNLVDYIVGTVNEFGKNVPITVQEHTVVTAPQDEIDILEEVADMINDDIRDHYDMSGLRELLMHVPKHILRDYYLENGGQL